MIPNNTPLWQGMLSFPSVIIYVHCPKEFLYHKSFVIHFVYSTPTFDFEVENNFYSRVVCLRLCIQY